MFKTRKTRILHYVGFSKYSPAGETEWRLLSKFFFVLEQKRNELAYFLSTALDSCLRKDSSLALMIVSRTILLSQVVLAE